MIVCTVVIMACAGWQVYDMRDTLGIFGWKGKLTQE